jgi:hypothetical protein
MRFLSYYIVQNNVNKYVISYVHIQGTSMLPHNMSTLQIIKLTTYLLPKFQNLYGNMNIKLKLIIQLLKYLHKLTLS